MRELARYRAREYDIDWDGGHAEARALFIALANSRQYGGHGCIAPRAVLDDGRLDLVVVDDLPLWRVLPRVPGFFRGTLQPGGGVAMHPFSRARVATPRALGTAPRRRAERRERSARRAGPSGRADRHRAAGLHHAPGCK